MPANVLIQTRIDPTVKKRSDAVRILLTRTANEGALPFVLASHAAAHDAWFRAKVQEALNDPRPSIPHAKVEKHFARRRAAASRKAR